MVSPRTRSQSVPSIPMTPATPSPPTLPNKFPQDAKSARLKQIQARIDELNTIKDQIITSSSPDDYKVARQKEIDKKIYELKNKQRLILF
jgi:hypothetical protein